MKVLIAIDNSEFSDAAVAAVVNRPWWGDTDILVYSVVPLMVPALNDFSPHYHELARIQSSELKVSEKLVADTVTKLKETLPYCTISGEVAEGNICDLIVGKASQWGCDLLIVGSHGRKGWSRLFLGSVAESVLNHAPCSVEIVKIPQPAETKGSKKDRKAAAKTNT
jgi:nucleotide-binding universal stress UspA family protein